MDVLLGIDTSNYRTSLCLVTMEGEIIGEQKQLLTVEEGEKGLQQSVALFQHIKRLPLLAKEMAMDDKNLVAVAVSRAPRPVEGSYMPVFLAGQAAAEMIAHFHQVPVYYTTHQEGHIAAGEYTMNKPLAADHFLAVHLSGGTSELLDCTRTQSGYQIALIGGTDDLHAGQLIDRVGVALGLPFPAGPYLEKLANESQEATTEEFAVPSSVNGYTFSFSGPETALLKAVNNSEIPRPAIARAAEKCIANTLEKVLRRVVENGFARDILIVGGVSANAYIRSRLVKRLEHPAVKARLHFADPAYAGDNAFGTARLGLIQYKRRKKTNII